MSVCIYIYIATFVFSFSRACVFSREDRKGYEYIRKLAGHAAPSSSANRGGDNNDDDDQEAGGRPRGGGAAGESTMPRDGNLRVYNV